MFKQFLVIALMFSATAFAQDGKYLCDWPVPEYTIDQYTISSVKSGDYYSAMSLIQQVYAPIFKSKGCKFVVVDGWADAEINAQAWKGPGVCYIQIFGGLARYPIMTKDAIIETACHEIGHHLGGRPHYSGESMSVEGQADRYATKVCMKLLGIPHSAPSLALASTLTDLNGEPRPKRSTRSKVRVGSTMQGHPPGQCRLDEYDAAAVGAPRRCCWYRGVCG